LHEVAVEVEEVLDSQSTVDGTTMRA